MPKFLAEIGFETVDNFWPKSKVIVLHFGPILTGNKSGQNLWQKLVLKKVTICWKRSKVIALHFGPELTGNKSGQNLWQKLVFKRVTIFGKKVRL